MTRWTDRCASEPQCAGDVSAVSRNERKWRQLVRIVVIERHCDPRALRVSDNADATQDVASAQIWHEMADKRHQSRPVGAGHRVRRIQHQSQVSPSAVYSVYRMWTLPHDLDWVTWAHLTMKPVLCHETLYRICRQYVVTRCCFNFHAYS